MIVQLVPVVWSLKYSSKRKRFSLLSEKVNVLKGSVLEPVLYLLYTNDIPSCEDSVGLNAVSYTHLDVYKRQIFTRQPKIQ